MPELPEVETTLRGIKPHISQDPVVDVIVRHPRLRFPIPDDLKTILNGQKVLRLSRRGKYILFEFPTGTLILHLGMSGRLSVLSEIITPKKHDHVDICFANNRYLRFTDPRRFGALLWTSEDIKLHPLLKNIGPEPLTEDFAGCCLWERAQGKKIAVKSFIMDSKTVAGVGNIYASEALFLAGIKPQKPAQKISLGEYQALAKAIKKILTKAIQKGGTTLKDFTSPNGSSGYFRLDLQVYGRDGELCHHCQNKLKSIRINNRSTVYCPHCQR